MGLVIFVFLFNFLIIIFSDNYVNIKKEYTKSSHLIQIFQYLNSYYFNQVLYNLFEINK